MLHAHAEGVVDVANWYRITRGMSSRSWLAVLPDEIYDKRQTSHIVRIMDALCGDSGVRGLRKRLMLKRLQTSLYETRYEDLDTVYSAIFALPRLDSEKYTHTSASLLTWAEQQEMDAKDAAYRRRISAYMEAFQFGATRKGLELAAKAGCGLECEVIDLTEHYGSLGLAQNGKNVVDAVPVDGVGVNDGSSFVVVVDGDVDMQVRKSMCDVMSRLSPADATACIITREEFLSNVAAEDGGGSKDVTISGVTASSRWWNVVRYVTGRPDWDYVKYPTVWVEPNKRKEAPRQALVSAQEETTDFTFTATSVSASSEHIGCYSDSQASLFPSLSDVPADVVMSAKFSLSRASSRRYTSSYYGGDDVVEWSYPTTIAKELIVDESSRYSKFWSSKEAQDGTEWLSFELRRAVPMNHMELAISRKPIRVVPYASSGRDANGDRVWGRLLNSDGIALSFTTHSWGGGSIAGEMMNVAFDFSVIVADAIKLEFERLSTPYDVTAANGVVTEYTFPWSIEASNVDVIYVVDSEKAFRQAKYLDPFGNVTETELRTSDPSAVLSSDYSYWMSQPNIGEDSVEWLVLDVRDSDGNPQRFDTIDVDAVYAGCQTNVYSSDDGVTWNPYPKSYELGSGSMRLSTRTASFLKLEFTSLCAMPYEVVSTDIPVTTRRFPYSVRNHVDSISSDSAEMSDAQKLLVTAEERYDDEIGDMEQKLGVTDVWTSVVANSSSYVSEGASQAELFWNTSYQGSEESLVSAKYGDVMASEGTIQSPAAQTPSISRTRYKFYDVGTHEYEVRDYTRSMPIAYVVGIRHISISLSGDLVSIGGMSPLVIDLSEERNIDNGHRGLWKNDGERLSPSTSTTICSFETRNIQTSSNFRSFEFATNQSPAVEKFDHPSDMSAEWSGVSASVESVEFGTSGAVLHVTPSAKKGYGASSQMKLVHGTSIAQAEVQLFAQENSKWTVECLDTYGEQIFSMEYSVDARRWYTLGTVFSPQPGGGWWDTDYSYRVKLPLDGPLAYGQQVFVPFIDVDALRTAGITTATSLADMKDMRLIYFNGISCIEVACDVTGNEELWFRAQQNVAAGSSADGAYHHETREFLGGYYVYFGDKSETVAAKRDWWTVFDDCGKYLASDVSETDAGTSFANSGSSVELAYRLPDNGFVEFEMTSATALVHLTGGVKGQPEVRFLVDYVDEDKAVQCYTFGQQLTFVVREPDGYESAYVSKWVDGKPPFSTTGATKVAIFWGSRGSQPVYHEGVVDPSDLRRRRIAVYIGSDTAWPCINNVYDERHYIEGVY